MNGPCALLKSTVILFKTYIMLLYYILIMEKHKLCKKKCWKKLDGWERFKTQLSNIIIQNNHVTLPQTASFYPKYYPFSYFNIYYIHDWHSTKVKIMSLLSVNMG